MSKSTLAFLKEKLTSSVGFRSHGADSRLMTSPPDSHVTGCGESFDSEADSSLESNQSESSESSSFSLLRFFESALLNRVELSLFF